MASSLSNPYKMAAGQNGKTPAPTSHMMSNASKILEKKGGNMQHIRRSTPDSEALASSDDDHDQNAMSHSAHSALSMQGTTVQKPARRASWLSEVQAGSQQRKFSVGSASNAQPGSGPTTPAAEGGPTGNTWGFGSGMMRPGPWSGAPGAWQQQDRQPMSKQTVQTGRMDWYGSTLEEDALVSPTSYHHTGIEGEGSFPFPIPMQPVRKTFRSQSYSVGQMEAEANPANATNPPNPPNPPTTAAHPRSGATGYPHRPSRPSMLSDNSGGGRPILGQLLEDDDDHPHSPVIYTGANLPRASYGKIDQGANVSNVAGFGKYEQASNIPNIGSGLLKQAAVENARAKQRISGTSAMTAATTPTTTAHHFSRYSMAQYPQTGMSAETDFDYTNDDEGVGDARRSEAKKALWQTSLGFGDVDDGSQSRRHSFADVPSRPRPVTSSLQSPRSHEGLVPSATGQHDTAVVEDQYFTGDITSLRLLQQAAEAQTMNPFAVPSVITNPQPDVYVVTFKCARAEVYYIPANTGLLVKIGDMVIVEGDRGLDLGTVSHARITIIEAKQLKEAATKQHFNWLMMFSRTMQSVTGTTSSTGLLANSNGERPSAVGGMGPRVPLPSNSQSSHPEHDIRPKMIRRLAQNHEIQMLRDKEGAEAKAKRVCQSKVSDHGLNMEILDAEFQFDWKKLTYFYYADSYVNFNELVTDLFKVYKTRIWMSAINPASFASPSAGLRHPGSTMSARPSNIVSTGPSNIVSAGPSNSVSPVDGRNRGPHRPTSREPVVHGEDTAHRFMGYQSMYGHPPTTGAPVHYTPTWAPPSAPPLAPPTVAYGSTDAPYSNYLSTHGPVQGPVPGGPLQQFFAYTGVNTGHGGHGVHLTNAVHGGYGNHGGFGGHGGHGGHDGHSPPYGSGAAPNPDDVANQFQNMSFGPQQH